MNRSSISTFLLFLYFLITSRFRITSSAPFAGDVSINCGANGASAARSGRQWLGDSRPKLHPFLQINGESTTLILAHNLASDDPVPFGTARVSRSPFSYAFRVDPGQKIIRLHFNPSSYKGFGGLRDLFTVNSGGFILLGNFSASITADALAVSNFAKEFCLNLQQNQQLTVTFSPETGQSLDVYAFINGIEIISVPPSHSYLRGGGIALQFGKESSEYVDGNTALEIIERRDLKHDAVLSNGDNDGMFPKWATEGVEKKNSTSIVPVNVGFRYLVRLHFSEVGLELAETGKLRFKVLINEMVAHTDSELLRSRNRNDFFLHRDYIVMMPGLKTDGKRDILISILSHDELRDRHGVLAGFEIVKLSNHDNSLASPNPLPQPRQSTSTITRYLSAILGHKNATSALAITIVSLINIIVYILRDIWDASSANEENRPSERAVRLFHHFSLREIQIATENFYEGHVIGRGGFGKVYKCLLRGNAAAVKRLRSGSDQGEREFLTEIETLSELRHINLVSLIGYCKEGREMILVYEYMPKGTLADHLYKLARRNRNCTSLTWKQRLNICIEAGRGLDYLHTGHRIIHRDVKASNILLDENFVAKVSDFGLAKAEDRSRLQSHVSTRVRGTFGYFDPYYMNTQRLTKKSDTYAFGVVLFEVLCGRPAIDSRVSEEERVLITWVRGKISNGEVEDMVDSCLRQEILPDSLKVFVEIAEKCLHDEPRNRPTMSQVVLQLESALEQQGDRILALPTHITPVASDQNPSNEDIIILSESDRQSRRAATTDTQSVILSPDIQSNLRYSPTNTREFGKLKKCSSLCFLVCCPCCWLWSKREKAMSHGALESSIPIMVHEEPHESPILPATRTAYTNFLELDRSSHMRRYFSLQEIRKATDSFNTKHLIGKGGFGYVFKGMIDDGATTVAIKRRDPSSHQGAHEFRTEILILSKLIHRNLVSLIGYCDEKDEMILVYEYMELGNLHDHLNNPSILLTWKQRLHICLDAASGLHYLHTGARQVVIHRNVKTTNVLLDKKLVPKMSGFGLSKVLHSDWDGDETQVTTRVKGTYGYFDPEYIRTSRLSVKSDVYSFGVILFEVLSARRPINPILSRKHVNLIEWGKSCFRKGKLDKIVDSNLKGQIAPKCLHKFVETAVACISEKGIDRPAMGDVIRNLELAVHLQEATAIDQGSLGPWMMTKTNSRGYLKESKYRDVMKSRLTQKDKLLSSSSEQSGDGFKYDR